MLSDPIVDQVRRVRQEYAAQFGYNLRALVSDLRKRQQLHAARLVSFPPKPALRRKTA